MTAIERLEETGIRRLGTPKSGFRYVSPGGKPVRGQAAERLHELKIPPAWTDVRVNPAPGGRLQAIGKDKAGRWQYRYSDAQVLERERRKYERLVAFGQALPAARRAIERGLHLRGLPRERVMACILRILSTCFMRPGSDVYAKENGSYGIATLKARHVHVRGDTVTFDYMGKSKQRQVRELRDRRVARVVRDLLAAPGNRVFKYQDDDGDWVPVTSQSLNLHIKEVMGERFSAKDFRTWSGTLICACTLARKREELVDGVTEERALPATGGSGRRTHPIDRRKVITAAVRETAEHLGNTPAVCKSSYIWPSILSSFYKGDVLSPYFGSVEELMSAGRRAQAACEKSLLSLLAKGRNAVPVVIAKKKDRRGKRRAETRLSRRMKASPRMKRLAGAFRTLH